MMNTNLLTLLLLQYNYTDITFYEKKVWKQKIKRETITTTVSLIPLPDNCKQMNAVFYYCLAIFESIYILAGSCKYKNININ